MILNNEFIVHAPPDTVWQLLDDMPSIVPCMPGASYLGREGDDHRVGIRMKVGAITTDFQGRVRFAEKDEAAHRAVIQGSGKDVGGKASASATLVATLHPHPPGGTRVHVQTDLAITGRLAQFGGGVLTDISSRLMAQFASRLEETLRERTVASPPTDTGPSAATPLPPAEDARIVQPSTAAAASRAPDPAPMDLGQVVLPVALARVRRFVLVPLTFFVLGWLAARYL